MTILEHVVGLLGIFFLSLLTVTIGSALMFAIRQTDEWAAALVKAIGWTLGIALVYSAAGIMLILRTVAGSQ